MEKLDKVKTLFSALGSRKRLRILKLLESGEHYCASLAHIVGISTPAAYRYLKAMVDAGLLRRRETEKLVYYSLAPNGTQDGKLARKVCALLKGDPTVKKDFLAMRSEKPVYRG